MTLGLRRWQGEADALRARCIADALADGRCIALTADDLGHDDATDFAHPNPRLLIVGGGHCGIALYDSARHLDLDLRLFDDRPASAARPPLADPPPLHGLFPPQIGNATLRARSRQNFDVSVGASPIKKNQTK